MADVAEVLGVAKGTLYLYVESKEALFDLVLRCADGHEPPPALSALPLPTPPPGATATFLRERLAAHQVLPALQAALVRARPGDLRAELAGIVGELYDLLARHRLGIKLVDRSAADHPELAALWFGGARAGVHAGIVAYLELRRRRLRPLADRAIAARLVQESVAFWAVHRHWDPHPQDVDEALARTAVVEFVVAALLPPPAPRRRRPATP
jgi:AcrR family transcriptional regulator